MHTSAAIPPLLSKPEIRQVKLQNKAPEPSAEEPGSKITEVLVVSSVKMCCTHKSMSCTASEALALPFRYSREYCNIGGHSGAKEPGPPKPAVEPDGSLCFSPYEACRIARTPLLKSLEKPGPWSVPWAGCRGWLVTEGYRRRGINVVSLPRLFLFMTWGYVPTPQEPRDQPGSSSSHSGPCCAWSGSGSRRHSGRLCEVAGVHHGSPC